MKYLVACVSRSYCRFRFSKCNSFASNIELLFIEGFSKAHSQLDYQVTDGVCSIFFCGNKGKTMSFLRKLMPLANIRHTTVSLKPTSSITVSTLQSQMSQQQRECSNGMVDYWLIILFSVTAALYTHMLWKRKNWLLQFTFSKNFTVKNWLTKTANHHWLWLQLYYSVVVRTPWPASRTHWQRFWWVGLEKVG